VYILLVLISYVLSQCTVQQSYSKYADFYKPRAHAERPNVEILFIDFFKIGPDMYKFAGIK
jgi:hypothetical protein